MRVVTTSEAVYAIKEVNPSRVAVAFVGSDWKEYVNTDRLDEIIVSPTFGSNPRAIREIKEAVGWDRVHFLDNLHAKLYLGERSAAIGSFNLTKNGLSGAGLEELGVITEDPAHLERLATEFKRLRALAIERYPSVKRKERQLAELDRLWNRSVAEGIVTSRDPELRIFDYQPVSEHNLSVIWCRNVDVFRDEGVLVTKDPSLSEATFEDSVSNWITALNDDDIQVGTWVLLWKARKDGKPDDRENPYWLYVHHAIEDAIKNDDYKKIVIQQKDKKVPQAPFALDPPTQRAIKAVLKRDDFACFRERDGELWSANSCRTDIGRFIDAVKEECLQSDDQRQQPAPLLT